MKNFLLYSVFALFLMAISTQTNASHVSGGHIEIKHITGSQYVLTVQLIRDLSGISFANNLDVDVFSRSTSTNISTFTIPVFSVDSITPSIYCMSISGLSVSYGIENWIYQDTIILDPNVYNDPAGYLFSFNTCCRMSSINNLSNAFSTGTNITTFFTPNNNSSPFPTSPQTLANFACNNGYYYSNFDFIDLDGDSLAYEFYAPFDNASIPTNGIVTPLSSPYVDPETQFPSVVYNLGFSVDNQIHGTGANPSPNRLQIDEITGEMTMIPDVAVAYYSVGVRVNEFRDLDNNGIKELIGSIFYDYMIVVEDCNLSPNTPPTVHLPQVQTLGAWNVDTIEFTGAPVCVELMVTDPDFISTVDLELVSTNYDTNDITVMTNSSIISNTDTLNTAICFQPDSFVANATSASVVALNPGCYDLRGDTLTFWFKFVGYSNAGNNSITQQNIYNSNDIDLFTRLTGNPNPGGTWTDLSNSGLLLPNGIFRSSMVNVLDTFNFMYIDQQPNYPADTSYLELRMKTATALDSEGDIENVRVFPNPASDNVTILVNTNQGISHDLRISNLQGQIVGEYRLNNNRIDISTEGLKSGYYIISVPGTNIKEKLTIMK